MPAKVLLIGTTQAPLEMIASVLHHFWTVETMLLGQIGNPGFDSVGADLAVISDILEPERQRWVETLRTSQPGLIIVKLNGYDSGPHAGADATVDEAHGPGALVYTIYELLTERGLGHKGWTASAVSAWVQ